MNLIPQRPLDSFLLTYADYRDMYYRDSTEIQGRKLESRSQSPTRSRDNDFYHASIAHNDSSLHDQIGLKSVGLVLIALIILEKVFNSTFCTIIGPYLSAIVLLTFIANYKSIKTNDN